MIADHLSNSDHEHRPGGSALPIKEVDSRDLMQGGREVVIRHGTELYRLSVTRAGKLILRK